MVDSLGRPCGLGVLSQWLNKPNICNTVIPVACQVESDIIVVNIVFLPQNRPPGWLDSYCARYKASNDHKDSRVDMMISVPVPWILWVVTEQPEPVILAIIILRFEPI